MKFEPRTMAVTWDGVVPFTRMIAVDPGDIHVGVAFFEAFGDPDVDKNWTCVDTMETDPDTFCDSLFETIADGEIDILVYERFLLYEDKAGAQTGSEFLTSQMIGVIKYTLRCQETHATHHDEARAAGKILACEWRGNLCADPHRQSAKHVVLVSQLAAIQAPTAGILRSRHIKSMAKQNKDTLGHQVSAELHGWYYLLKGRHS